MSLKPPRPFLPVPQIPKGTKRMECYVCTNAGLLCEIRYVYLGPKGNSKKLQSTCCQTSVMTYSSTMQLSHEPQA